MTPKHRKFCEAYVETGSAYAAMIKAGYSKSYAKSRAKDLMKRSDIQDGITALRKGVAQLAVKTATDVVNEYSKIAFTDRINFLKPDPDFEGHFMYKSPDELNPDERDIVEKVTPHWHTRKREINGQVITVHRQEFVYVLSDKANALQQMGRHFGIFDDKLKLIGAQQNPFKNASPEQLAKLKAAWVKTMSQPAIEGDFKEVKNG